jgi:hypothetical protein
MWSSGGGFLYIVFTGSSAKAGDFCFYDQFHTKSKYYYFPGVLSCIPCGPARDSYFVVFTGRDNTVITQVQKE